MLLLPLYIGYALALNAALACAGHRTERTTSSGTRPRPARLLIVGATGGTGRELVAQALARGYTVTALVRDPSKLQPSDPRLIVMKGDVRDPSAVEEAVRGQDAVISALGHKRYLGPTRVLSDGTRNLLRAMEVHRVPRLVCETSLGIGDSAGRLGLYYSLIVIPVILPFYFWDKTRQERIIAGSGVEWVIVRPGVLTNGPMRGRSRHGFGVGSFLWSLRVSRADVADFMLSQLECDTYLRRAPGLRG